MLNKTALIEESRRRTSAKIALNSSCALLHTSDEQRDDLFLNGERILRERDIANIVDEAVFAALEREEQCPLSGWTVCEAMSKTAALLNVTEIHSATLQELGECSHLHQCEHLSPNAILAKQLPIIQ